ncbi:GTP cyclohydrolase 1 [Propionigenium maris DSM 9537]|uniref:GTP cyclohydrolase 1 n=1 Tax=Propionigenium maris DSM 9537 TaxID=1123000 RepID=A0A9W6GP74_9FUSO|nr:GTP cyclohydrolase I FolE [Propionigenium maris]GLI57207.1 GTP cyclohydrolase 1 [Propionigenium maris DSM 9537]
MAIDKKKIEEHVRGILEALGENPHREGLIDTPKRVANMYEEVFEGIKYSNKDIAEKFGVTFEEEDIYTEEHMDMVIMKDIELFSYCEHHLAMMYNMKAAVAYLPNKKVLGLSKIARIAEMAAKRLQLQERIGKDIAEIICMATGSDDVAVIITGEHGCMTTRGIKKPGTKTTTTTLRGRFERDNELLNKFLMLYKA